MRILIVVTAALLAIPSLAFAAAWTQEQGHGQVIATAAKSRADREFDGSRKTSPRPRYDKLDMQALTEFGVTDRFTLMLAPGVQHIKIGPSGSPRRATPVYGELGARYRLAQGRNWVVSGQALVHWTGNSDTHSDNPVDITGTEVDLRALFGYTFAVLKRPAFLDVQVSHRFRSNGSPNEVHADVTLGVAPHRKWLIMGQLFNVMSEGAGKPGFPSYDYLKVQPSIVYKFGERWAAQAGAFTTYTGRHSIQENGIVLGLWYWF